MSVSGKSNSSSKLIKPRVPEALQLREEAISAELRRAVETGGKTGIAAELLETILLPHLAKERVDLLEPLALLPAIAHGGVTPSMVEVLPQIEQLKRERHQLRVEHATILSAIKVLVAAAREEGKPQHAGFAERLLLRAWLDDSVFTPLAVLIGKVIQLQVDPGAMERGPQDCLGQPSPTDLPQALRVSHTRLSAALAKAVRARGQTMIAAEVVAQLFETHLYKEEKQVLRILGLLESIATNGNVTASEEDLSQWDLLEPNEKSLHQEHALLVHATERLLATARGEGLDEVVELAEQLLMRIRLDEEVFYPAALLIRDYLKRKAGSNSR
jgi:hypothetical protein